MLTKLSRYTIKNNILPYYFSTTLKKIKDSDELDLSK